MTEGDDSTIYLHTTEDDGSPPEMFLTDFAQLIASQQQSPPRVPALTLSPSYVPPGQPPNAPIRQSRKTAVAGFIVNENNSTDEDDNVPLARSAYAKNKKQGQKRGAPRQQQSNGATAPPQKKQKPSSLPPKPAAAKKCFKIIKQWSKDVGPTPPPNDDDNLLVIDGGENYIRNEGFTDDDDDDKTEEHIEPSQMDKINT